jgi:hypothetical protein
VRCARFTLACAVAYALSGCGAKKLAAPPARDFTVPLSTPASDRPGAPCTDVGTLRACWPAGGPPVLVPRPVPSAPAASSPMGWRCAWPAQAHVCVDRRADAPAFACDGDRCTQPQARRPDDGEWTCTENGGAIVCVGGERAAGVVAGPPDPAWVCGARRGQRADDLLGARVCVDFAPDFPDGDGTHWRCRPAAGAANGRVCERAADPGVLAGACERARPCLDGAVCIENRCVPARPAPSCWLDDDCPGGACRFGTCREGATP